MESELLSYIAEKPTIKSCSNFVYTKYNTYKTNSSLFGYITNKTENYATYMVGTLKPVVTKTVRISTTLAQPVVGKIDNPIKSIDHFTCEKLKSAEKTVDNVMTCSKQKIHNARLVAEDFFIGKCVHTIYKTTSSAIGGIETTLEKMSLIKRKADINTNLTVQQHSGSTLSQSDYDKTEMEFLKTRQFETKQHMLNILANPQLWCERVDEYRELAIRINHLHKRIMEDGLFTNIHSNVVHMISLYVTSIEAIVWSIISSVKSCSNYVYMVDLKNLYLLEKCFEIFSDRVLMDAFVLANKFPKIILDTGTIAKDEFCSIIHKMDFLLKLYFHAGFTEISSTVTNKILPSIECNIKYLIPVIFDIYFSTFNKWNFMFATLQLLGSNMDQNSNQIPTKKDQYRMNDVDLIEENPITPQLLVSGSSCDSSCEDISDID